MKQGLKLTLLTRLLALSATLGMTNAIACQAGDLILRAGEAWAPPIGECPTQVYRFRHRNENSDNTGQL